ncbi:MAG: hypothetical protein JST36_10515 [Bacteroidetes bacterium]|nr:hypothetical protein [Bacteroidota bacterium]
MKRSALFLLPLLLFGMLFSCSKSDSNNSVKIGKPYQHLDEALASVAPVALSTTVIVSQGAQLVAPGGTRFYIPPNAFETMTGGKVTGSVNVTINDWLKKGDMIYGKVLPLNYGKVLQSGGEAYLMVTQNGTPVRVKSNLHIAINIPQFGGSDPGFTGWRGLDFLGSANNVNWVEDTANLHQASIGDTIQVVADTLPYVALAMPGIYTETHDFSVTMTTPGNVILEQTMGVALYDNMKMLFPIPSAQNGVFKATQVPEGAIHMAVMGVYAGEFYGGILEIPSPGTDSSYNVTVNKLAPATFKLQLNAL